MTGPCSLSGGRSCIRYGAVKILFPGVAKPLDCGDGLPYPRLRQIQPIEMAFATLKAVLRAAPLRGQYRYSGMPLLIPSNSSPHANAETTLLPPDMMPWIGAF